MKKVRIAVIIFTILSAVLVTANQIDIFPYQYIYFNELVGGLHGGAKYFDTDYWAASSLEALNWLGQNKKNNYNVYTCGLPLTLILYFPPNMTWVGSADKADYAICSTSQIEYKKIPGKIIHTVERDDVPLSLVIQLKK